MIKYEYREIEVDTGAGNNKTDPVIDAARLTNYGQEGWRVVHIYTAPKLGGENVYYRALIERAVDTSGPK